jgi:hypothetical protein
VVFVGGEKNVGFYPEFSSRPLPQRDLQQATELYVISLYYCIIFINCGLTLSIFLSHSFWSMESFLKEYDERQRLRQTQHATNIQGFVQSSHIS